MTSDPVTQVLDAVTLAPPRCGATRVVAIDGPSGSGKTTLAAAVADRLGCPVVHMDDLYAGWDGLSAAVDRLSTTVLTPLAAGRPARHPVWDWSAQTWGASSRVPRTDVLVVEGCGSSVRPAGDHAALRVWVEADRGVRRARGLARDSGAYAPHWERWAAQEAEVFAADGTRARADLVVDTTPSAPAVQGRMAP